MSLVVLARGDRSMHLVPEGDVLRARADAPHARATVLDRVTLGHGRIALRAPAGFLTVRPDPGHSFGLYAVPAFGVAAAFEEVLWPDGSVSLRSHLLTYVSLRPVVVVNRVVPGPEERLRIAPAGTAAVPRQRAAPSRPPVRA